MTEEISKIYTCAVKGIDDEDVAIASTGAIDRDGEIIDPKGWELDNYRAVGLPIQVDHDPSTFGNIGNALWVKVTGGKLKFKPSFHETTQAARDAKALWDIGAVKSFSVGFIPKEWIDGTEKDKFRRKYTKQELLEISLTPIPSNTEAVRETTKAIRKAFKTGLIKDPDFAEHLAPGSTKDEEPEEKEDKIEILTAAINALIERMDNLEANQLEVVEEPLDEAAEEAIGEVDETIIIPDESIVIPDEEKPIVIDGDELQRNIKEQTNKAIDVILATRKGRVVEY